MPEINVLTEKVYIFLCYLLLCIVKNTQRSNTLRILETIYRKLSLAYMCVAIVG